MHHAARWKIPGGFLMALVLLLAAPAGAQAPAPFVVEPPSNEEVGISIDRYIGNPANAPAKISHDTMYVQRIFGAGDKTTGSAGEILAPGQQTDLATLLPRDLTSLFTTPKQLIFYVVSGKGRIDDGRQYWDISSGIGALVPANVAHRLANTGDEPLKMILYSFTPWSGARVMKDIVVRDSHKLLMIEHNVHWQHNTKLLFGSEFGVGRVLVITFGPMTIAGPHASPDNPDPKGGGVQWINVSDSQMIMQLGSEIRRWPIHTGFITPQNAKTVHGRLNVGDTIATTLFISGGGLPNPAAAANAPPPAFWHDPPLKGEVASQAVAKSYYDAVVPGRPLPK
jgi:mannose-6-phosphate isomerase-like protein (cupin superfamily)